MLADILALAGVLQEDVMVCIDLTQVFQLERIALIENYTIVQNYKLVIQN